MRALDPRDAIDPGIADPIARPPDVPPRPSWAQALVGALALVAAWALLVGPGSPGGPSPADPDFEPVVPTPIVAPVPIYSSPAVETFEEFVTIVDRGDTAGALELVAEELPEVLGIGTAQYPHLPTDAGLWEDGRLDRTRLKGFVGYLSALPGSVSIGDCDAFADGPRVVVVSCEYSTTGGVLAPLGQEPEMGQLFGIMVDGRVAGLVRKGDLDLGLWNRFAAWTARNNPGVKLGTADPTEKSWLLDLAYSGDSAREFHALATEMALASLPVGSRRM